MMEPPFATLADEIASVPSKVTAATSGADDQALRRRPEPGEWSALEVVGHLVDKMRIWRARVQAIAVEERPRIDLYDQDALVTAQSYRTAQLQDLLEELAAGCPAFAATVSSLPEETAHRSGIHPEYGEITLRQCVQIPLASVGPHLIQLRGALELPERARQ
jgi:uncharacterized damage-inducible protein DinB